MCTLNIGVFHSALINSKKEKHYKKIKKDIKKLYDEKIADIIISMLLEDDKKRSTIDETIEKLKILIGDDSDSGSDSDSD